MSGSRKSVDSRASKQRPAKPQFHYSFLKILTGSDLSRRRLPYMRAVSSRRGPTVWLTACCHGDEVGGIVVVQEVFKRLRKVPLQKGTLHAFPLMNPLGFEAAARHITLSEEDLNRSFPGNPNGTLAERIADMIFQAIVDTKPDAVLDLHNDWIRSIPYAVLDPPPREGAREADLVSATLATATGFLLVDEPNPLRHTLSYSLVRRGIPAVTIELGESYVVNELNVELGVSSILNVLAHLGMIAADEPFRYALPEPVDATTRLAYSQEPTCSTSGIVRFLVRPGALIRKGQPIAKIVNAFGRHLETLTTRHDAVVLGLADSSVAFPGAPLIALGMLPES